MDMERVKQLRADLAALPNPERQFDMGHFFSVYAPEELKWWSTPFKPENRYFHKEGEAELNKECGTAGCIAGWCCRFYGIDASSSDANRKAQSYLGLSGYDESRLFWFVRHHPTHEHALARLDWLIRNGSMRGYDLASEGADERDVEAFASDHAE